MRVEIINGESAWEVEQAVNDAINGHDNSEIIDIKFCLETNRPPYSIGRNYAVIVWDN